MIGGTGTMRRSIVRVATVTGALLLIPLVAMQVSSEWNWGIGDFIFMGGLIFGTGMLFELARQRAAGNTAYVAASGIALVTTFLLIWINAAVGIIGDDDWPNGLYLGVVVTEIIGVLLARLDPRGMARALFTTAIAVALVPVIVLIAESSLITAHPPGTAGVFVLNSFFAVMLAVSGLLFRRSGHSEVETAAEDTA